MDRMNTKDFWDRLDLVVKSKCKTYVVLADHTKLSLATLYNNRSKDRYPSTDDLMTISRELDTSIDWLLFGETKSMDLSVTDLESVKAYLNAPKDVRTIVDNIIKGMKL